MHGLFAPPNVQVANVRRANRARKWRYTDGDFDRLPPPPTWSSATLAAVVLVPYLDTAEETFEELWDVIAHTYAETSRTDRVVTVGQRLIALRPHRRGLHWEVLGLEANRGCPITAPTTHPLAGAGVLAAVAHHRRWVHAMDGARIPHVAVGAYRLNLIGESAYTHVPCITHGTLQERRHEVRLTAVTTNEPMPTIAVPCIRLVSGA